MDFKIKKFIFLSFSITFFSLISAGAHATCGYIYYPGWNTEFDSCCTRYDSCGGSYVYEESFSYHVPRARAADWAGTSEYAWIPDPADP